MPGCFPVGPGMRNSALVPHTSNILSRTVRCFCKMSIFASVEAVNTPNPEKVDYRFTVVVLSNVNQFSKFTGGKTAKISGMLLLYPGKLEV